MHLLVGIGNPGKQYENTRHNVGFILLDSLADPTAWKSKSNALIQKTLIGNHTVLLVKPQTYVNLSGKAVQELAHYFKVESEKVIVTVDDVNLPTGSLRIRSKGSHGGHNGLKSIIQCMGDSFPRIRVGVGLCPDGWELSDFVLGKLNKSESDELKSISGTFSELLVAGMAEGWEEAAGRFNRRS